MTAITLTQDRTRFKAFKYQWYKTANDVHWQSNAYESLRAQHLSNDVATFLDDTAMAVRAGLTGFACSNWWGTSPPTGDDDFGSDSSMIAYLAWLSSPANPWPDFELSVYAEIESQVDPNPAKIAALFEHHRATKFGYRNYERRRAIHVRATEAAGHTVYVAAQPVVAVYQTNANSTGGRTPLDDWLAGKRAYEDAHGWSGDVNNPGETVYLDMELYGGYTAAGNYAKIDSWHKYTADNGTYYHQQAATDGGFSVTICPGFHNPPAAVRIARSISGFTAAIDVAMVWVNALKALGLGLHSVYVSTWDEFPEASHVCQAVANGASVPIANAPDGLVAGEYIYALGQRLPGLRPARSQTGESRARLRASRTRAGLVNNGRTGATVLWQTSQSSKVISFPSSKRRSTPPAPLLTSRARAA